MEFYAPWCGHCNKFAADYTAVAAALAADPPVNVGRVDGSAHRSLSARFSVTGFPSFFYLPPAADATQDAVPGGPPPMRFTGGRGVESLVAFARAGGAGGKAVTITPPPSVVEQLLGRKGSPAAAAAGRGAPAAHAAVAMEVVREVAERADRWLVAQGGLTPEVRVGILVASAVILAGGGLIALIAVVAALGGLVTVLVKSVGGRRRPQAQGCCASAAARSGRCGLPRPGTGVYVCVARECVCVCSVVFLCTYTVEVASVCLERPCVCASS